MEKILYGISGSLHILVAVTWIRSMICSGSRPEAHWRSAIQRHG